MSSQNSQRLGIFKDGGRERWRGRGLINERHLDGLCENEKELPRALKLYNSLFVVSLIFPCSSDRYKNNCSLYNISRK